MHYNDLKDEIEDLLQVVREFVVKPDYMNELLQALTNAVNTFADRGDIDYEAVIKLADIIPIMQKKEGVLDKAYEVRDAIKAAGLRVKVDDSDKNPGWKFSEQEMRGIPVRVEMGPRDIEANQAIVVRRDTREKITVAIDELAVKLPEILDTIQKDMLERARAHRDAHTYVAVNYDEFKETAANKPGFIKAMWCGEQACEDKIKEETTCTSRCMPFAQEQLSDVCVCCGKPAKKMVYWGKAY